MTGGIRTSRLLAVDAAYDAEPWSEFAAGSLVLLIPGQPPGALAVELFVLAAVAGVALGWLSRPSRRAPEQPVASWVGTTVVPAAVVALAPVVAGVGLLTESLGGLYWLPAAVAVGLLGGLTNAWVLLVEILR